MVMMTMMIIYHSNKYYVNDAFEDDYDMYDS